MALPFIFSPDGMTVTETAATVRAELAARGASPASDSSVAVRSTGGVKWLTTGGGGSEFALRSGFSETSVWLGFRAGVGMYTGSGQGEGIRVLGATTHLSWAIRSGRSLVFYRANTVVLTVTDVAESDYVEVELTLTTIAVYLNGAATPVASGTHAGPGPAFTTLGLYRGGTAFRDLYLATSRLGEITVSAAAVASPTTTGNLVGGTAAQAMNIDTPTAYAECEPGEFIKGAIGTAITDNPLSIPIVQITQQARKSGTALLPEKIIVETSAGAVDITPEIPLGLGFGASVVTLTADPNDSAAWTKAKVNGLTVGGKG